MAAKKAPTKTPSVEWLVETAREAAFTSAPDPNFQNMNRVTLTGCDRVIFFTKGVSIGMHIGAQAAVSGN